MKIITHDGMFHADEVFACALLLEYYDDTLEIVRTRQLSKEHFTNQYFLIDQGKVFEPENLNFDHHQYKNGIASNMLILNWLYDNKHIPQHFYEGVKLDMMGISHVDTNGYDFKSMNSFGAVTIFHVNNIIKTFNHISQNENANFLNAVEFAKLYFQGSYNFHITMKKKSMEIWNKGMVYGKVREVTEYPHFWKDYNEENYILYPEKGKWVVQSKDSSLYPLQETGNEEFFHKNKFIAVFKTRSAAFNSLVK